MNGWAVFFLGVIAVATLAMAIMQIGLILYTGRLVRRVTAMVDQIEGELKPLFASAHAITRDAARVASLAVSQMETIQNTILAPAREGKALLAGLRAVIAVLRGLRNRPQEGRTEDEESLFI